MRDLSKAQYLTWELLQVGNVNLNLKYSRTTEESRGMPALLIKSPSQFECNSSGWSCSMFEPLFVTAALSSLFVVKEALNSENEIL